MTPGNRTAMTNFSAISQKHRPDLCEQTQTFAEQFHTLDGIYDVYQLLLHPTMNSFPNNNVLCMTICQLFLSYDPICAFDPF